MTDFTISLGNVTSTSNATLNSDGSVTGSEGAIPSGNKFTDVIYQEIKLYIEGVQVPFTAISISQSIGTYPSAMISVPPQAGLMDIARYYQPKVHIFYTDQITGGDRLLFWGHIAQVEYSRSRNPASSSISFHCLHKNELMRMITLDYAGYMNQGMINATNPNAEQSAVTVDMPNSELSIINGLSGITGVQTDATDLLGPSNTKISEADVSKAAIKFQGFIPRYAGMAGSLLNFWNQLKRQSYLNPQWSTVMTSLYIPLVEDGLKYFDRLSGHYTVESYAENHREQYCPHDIPSSDVKHKILIPPSKQLSSVSAIKAALSVYAAKSQMGYSGELTDFVTMMSNFFYSVEYEYLTLASPAAVALDPTTFVNPDSSSAWSAANRMSVETIVKPQTPFYYAPVCNVVYPQMFTTISVQQDEVSVPTRVTAYTDMIPNDGGATNVYYRAPESVREAVAVGVGLVNASGSQQPIDLTSTTGPSNNVPGKYEEGRGIIQRKVVMPNWLSLYVSDKIPDVADPTTEAWPAQGTQDYTDMVNMHEAWVDRYGYDITQNDGVITRTRNTSKDVMDPNSVQSKIQPFQRILFNSADYEFVKQVEQARSGVIEMVFNPYIICGYPMDILDSSPAYPCFHATCSSITHNITASSISTTVSFVGAMTYAEMSLYYIPPVHPWLQNILSVNNVTYDTSSTTQSSSTTNTVPSGQVGTVANSNTTATTTTGSSNYGEGGTVSSVAQTLINNPTALAAANDYYKTTLGVGAADPSLMYDFTYGQPAAVTRANGVLASGVAKSSPDGNGIETNPYMSAVGNLTLAARQIEGKEAIKAKFGLEFIDLDPNLYSQSSATYLNPILDKSILLEPGASLFLDYRETADFINASAVKEEIKALNQ